ncbi:polysaccharide biosynthesis/export family protein [Arhodomonas sp. SL1]|uniref:polysaccharide biosynthesis/export family protein n=1 Tax=Arhodomonas sp. SL1 TaxID=3425691 RepID=UPI003F884A1F
MLVWLVLLALAVVLAGCAGQPTAGTAASDFQQDRSQQARVDKLNEQLAVQSAMGGGGDPIQRERESYRLGRDDLIEITVLGVPELAREVRIDGDGMVTLPLIGEVNVADKTVQGASELIADRYEESYLRDPQVSVLVKEYRSLRITVLGSVQKPQVYSVQRRLGLLEALALAGGLTEKAGRMVYVNDRVDNPDGEGKIRRNLVVSLDEVLAGGSGAEDTPDLTLSDGAVINVPEAGVIYVEGAVEKPGVYPLQGETSVLQAVTMAGGLQFKAKDSGIRVLRASGDGGGAEEFGGFNINTLRKDPDRGLQLRDGDVVVVEASGVKSALQGIANTAKGIFGFGYSLN